MSCGWCGYEHCHHCGYGHGHHGGYGYGPPPPTPWAGYGPGYGPRRRRHRVDEEELADYLRGLEEEAGQVREELEQLRGSRGAGES